MTDHKEGLVSNVSKSQSYHHTSQHDFDIEESGSEKFNTKALHVKPTEDPPPEPSPDYDFDDQHKHVIPFNQQKAFFFIHLVANGIITKVVRLKFKFMNHYICSTIN
uniref:Uncharacterized protein n=1 Tax=Magallana gigas TaxID=29159 RepID=K1RHN1_MAGGI